MKKGLERNERICKEKFSTAQIKYVIKYSEEERIIWDKLFLNTVLEISMDTDRMVKER